MSTVLECADLTAGYGHTPAIRGVSLAVTAGQVVTVLGANGAGKTTTLLTLGGVLAPMTGQVRLMGKAVRPRRPHLAARRGLALVPDDRAVLQCLTVKENLHLADRGRASKAAVDDALDVFDALRKLLKRRAGTLSGGEQQMLAIARAVVAKPKVLMVDEASHGLAPIIVERLLETLGQIAREFDSAVLLVEQHVDLALEVSDWAYVLSQGALVLQGPAAELRGRRDLLEASYLGEQGTDLGSSSVRSNPMRAI
jgi:branched-chain amino acid transport system ATP-binding protein